MGESTKTATESPVLLDIEGLKTWFRVGGETIRAVDGVSLQVPAGKTVALVGESGCGKSVTALSVARLVPEPPGVIAGGSIRVAGQDVLTMSREALRELRGSQVAYVFQDPGQSLNPVLRVGTQLEECRRSHRQQAGRSAVELLRCVGLPDPERVLSAYPHELSGGMKQRVMLAMALACSPQLLIADEPTTALDVTVQAQILSLLQELQSQFHMGVLLITHNLGLVAEYADYVYVMYAGQIVESGPAASVIRAPAHPYTQGLIGAVPVLQREGGERPTLRGIPGMVPNPAQWPAGCRFADRCDYVTDSCRQGQVPQHVSDEGANVGRAVACHHPRHCVGATQAEVLS